MLRKQSSAGGFGGGSDSGGRSSRLKAAAGTASSSSTKRGSEGPNRLRKYGGGVGGTKWNSSGRELDRKSSRGMIYENEELRLRTININAEVERGQSDIRKLRRENEQLKREIWTLRDEYDRINKKMCAQKDCSSCEHIASNSDSQSEDLNSCDSCKKDDDEDDGDCDIEPPDKCLFIGCNEYVECSRHPSKTVTTPLCCSTKSTIDDIEVTASVAIDFGGPSNKEITENFENSQKTLNQRSAAVSDSTTSFVEQTSPATSLLSRHNCKTPPSIESVSNKLRENLHVNFGHLSVLSEENLTPSSSDGGGVVVGGETICCYDNSVNPMSNPNDDGSGNGGNECSSPKSPLHEIQSILPSLAHFENIPYATSTLTSNSTGTTSSIIDKTAVSAILQRTEADVPVVSTATTTNRSPKHFFSPIKPRTEQQLSHTILPPPPPPPPPLMLPPSPPPPLPPPPPEPFVTNRPDLFVVNALASPYHYQLLDTNLLSGGTPQKTSPLPPPPLTSSSASLPPSPPLPAFRNSPSSLFYDSNFDDLLHEIETLQMQLENGVGKYHANEKFSTIDGARIGIPVTNNMSATTTSLSGNCAKPYRSEMNLVVSCNGKNPIITPITKTNSASMATGFQFNANYFSLNNARSGSGSRSSSSKRKFSNLAPDDSPTPSIPQPMILFPQSLTYLGGGIGAGAGGGSESGADSSRMDYNVAAMHTGSVPTLTNFGMTGYAAAAAAQPTTITTNILPLTCMTDISNLLQQQQQQQIAPSSDAAAVKFGEEILSPRTETDIFDITMESAFLTTTPTTTAIEKREMQKSPIAARRKLSNQLPKLDCSGDVSNNETVIQSTDGSSNAVKRVESNSSEHNPNDSSSSSDTAKRKSSRRVSILFNNRKKSTEKEVEAERDRETEENTQTNKAIASTIGTTLVNEILQKGRRSPNNNNNELVTQSTPNSPHSSSLRRASMTGNSPHRHRHGSGASTGSGHGHHHHHSHHGHQHSIGSDGGVSGEKQTHHIGTSKSTTSIHKCSRRLSEGTVVDTFDGSDRQFSSSYGVVAVPATDSSGGGSGTRRLDSFHDPGTSVSERNSNSFASSRESSTSQSIHSQRRKISVSSHNGGKIPWCGCWGNGCL